MINDNTIISSFNDRPTLLEWLKKVEEALKTDTATAIKFKNTSPNHYIASIEFADGSKIETGDIAFPDTIEQVTITNGELIVNYVSGAVDNLGKINAYADVIVINSETNTTGIGNNLEVNGDLLVHGTISTNENFQVNGNIGNLENIVDKAGRHRFFDMPLSLHDTLNNLGLNMTYGKIGLSGNHLSIVAIIANKSGNAITIPQSSIYAYCDLGRGESSWVMNKIYPLETKDSPNGYYIAKANAAKILDGWNLPMTNVDNIALEKETNNIRLLIASTNISESAVELPSGSSLRITVDLIIDLE